MNKYELPFNGYGIPIKEDNSNLPVNVVEKPIKVTMKRIYCKKCGNELASAGVPLFDVSKHCYHCNSCNTDYISAAKYPAICFVESEDRQ